MRKLRRRRLRRLLRLQLGLRYQGLRIQQAAGARPISHQVHPRLATLRQPQPLRSRMIRSGLLLLRLAHAAQSDMTRAQRAAAAASQTDDLEAQGEKYLYGNGVAGKLCRARTNLLGRSSGTPMPRLRVVGHDVCDRSLRHS